MNVVFDFIAALVTAALAGLGVGGGGLLVLWLTFVTGTEQLAAQGINILFYICASGASLPVHIKKRKLSLAVLLTLALTGAAGRSRRLYSSRFNRGGTPAPPVRRHARRRRRGLAV